MKIYNSLTRKVEDFIPADRNNVKIYTCGPTVYHYAHIGNLRTYIFEDILEKTLIYLGFKVNRVMNITDVGHLTGDSDEGEDKLILGARREKKTVLEIAEFYTDAFKKDFALLNLKWPEVTVPATACVDTYIEIIQELLNKNYAYMSNGNIYFDVSKLKKYHVFGEHKSEELLTGARDGVELDFGKRNQQDFVLWFTKSKFDNQELKWNSPWGVGYPGWHMECSGISYKYQGDYIDIHCGGVDNKFPHHTNEIAQSESFFGKEWCKYWFHPEHLNMASGKMSKSDGTFVTLSDLIDKGYSAEVYKFFCLLSNYRKTLMFSFEALDSAKSAYEKLLKKVATLDSADGKVNEKEAKALKEKFENALKNDLNTPLAIAAIFDVLKSDANASTKLFLIRNFDEVLGLNLIRETAKNEVNDVPEEIARLAKERWEAKKVKNFAEADRLRLEVETKGFKILDSKDGFKIEKL